MIEQREMKHKIVCVVGLGYVGRPLAKAFSKHLKTIGFDVDNEKIRVLNNDNEANIEFTTDPSKLKQADFVIIAVPTPVTKSKEPDLRYVKLFCFAKTFTKTAYAINRRNSRQESKARCHSGIGIYCLSRRYRRDS